MVLSGPTSAALKTKTTASAGKSRSARACSQRPGVGWRSKLRAIRKPEMAKKTSTATLPSDRPSVACSGSAAPGP